MLTRYYQVDAFTSRVFGGNPAGVCVLEQWPHDELLQRIAAENNLSETAFFTPQEDHFHLRWFTPTVEVDLCGHATLASAFVLFSELGYKGRSVGFQSRSGWLSATRRDEIIELDFPSRPPGPCSVPEKLLRGLGAKPREVLKSRDYLAVFDSPAEVAALEPSMDLFAQLDSLGVIATASGPLDALTASYLKQQLGPVSHESTGASLPPAPDFVSRFFAPQAGVPEDPVTGSAHSTLIPFWAERLGKSELLARQISKRGGELYCRHLGDRVGIGGRAVVYSRGELEIPA